MTYQGLIKNLVREGYLKSTEVIEAFKKIDRAHFLPDKYKDRAGEDYPLPIGFGQTNSQPRTVAFMLELLDAKKGYKVLDIGSGSGWTSALLSYIVGDRGQVFGIEIIPELKEFGEKNIEKLGIKNVLILQKDGSKGLEKAPFDRILVSAAARKAPKNLKKQLKIGGILVIPVGDFSQSIVKFKKISEDEFKEEVFPGFAFVPLVSK
ncbi:protein-L-isoaspartate O-methyltransferase [bacterium (Candidatus Torokbacteria) CG_4_10_14_0_2_um_filter_35_8]|nr:MAG: protein-L-isoaspartate O-methyltransferase [bacterium (Candidatus Torokbacteria) CG_4_10_14_0_2_um_filter_35_8]